MINDVINDAIDRMKKTIEALKKEYGTLRAGRATPSLLDKVMVDYYGAMTPINQMAKLATPEPRLLVIEPWDKSVLADIERAISKSDLGLTPNNDGTIIRIAIPQLTQERRAELVKVSKKKAEETRVAIRNIRRDANDQLKDFTKEGDISEDDNKRGQEEIQKLTDKYIAEVEQTLDNKEKEIMEV